MCDYVNNAYVQQNDYISLIPCQYKSHYKCTSSSDNNIQIDCIGNTKLSSSSGDSTSESITQCITNTGRYDRNTNKPSDITNCILENGAVCEYPKLAAGTIKFPINSPYPIRCTINKCSYYYDYSKNLGGDYIDIYGDVVTNQFQKILPYPIEYASDRHHILAPPNDILIPANPNLIVDHNVPLNTPACVPVIPPTKAPTPSPTSITAQTFTNTYSLYPYMLPITIPSIIKPTDPEYTKNEIPDLSVSSFWISESSIPTSGYSDMSIDFDALGNTIPRSYGKWTGLTAALSKCNEFDGTAYPLCTANTPARTPCSSSSNNPTLKPNCYAVVTQSDYNGTADSAKSHTFNYNLVELPNNLTVKNSLSQFPNPKPAFDKNYLFCQTQFYTWVKDSSIPYYNPPPSLCPIPKTPSLSPSNTPSLYCPSPSPPVLSCPAPVYPSSNAGEMQQIPDSSSFFAATPAVDLNSLVGYQSPARPDNTTRNIIIGVVVGIILIGGGLYWYLNYGPGKPPEIETPEPSPIKIKTKKGGYFYY